jgi:CO dehydrogenase maturation factor
MGTVKSGGSGCVCPEHVILKRILSHLIIGTDDVVIMDMEAGLEHLARGTTDLVDRIIVVVEPGARSVQTYHSVKRLAADLGVEKVSVVANKVRDEADEQFVREQVPQKTS